MRVPHETKIHSQTFNKNKLEFVWRFDDQQFILGVEKTGVYIEYGDVNDAGDYINTPNNIYVASRIEDFLQYEFPIRIQHPITPEIILDDSLWKNIGEYNFFSNGKDLVPLMEDIVEYFK